MFVRLRLWSLSPPPSLFAVDQLAATAVREPTSAGGAGVPCCCVYTTITVADILWKPLASCAHSVAFLAVCLPPLDAGSAAAAGVLPGSIHSRLLFASLTPSQRMCVSVCCYGSAVTHSRRLAFCVAEASLESLVNMFPADDRADFRLLLQDLDYSLTVTTCKYDHKAVLDPGCPLRDDLPCGLVGHERNRIDLSRLPGHLGDSTVLPPATKALMTELDVAVSSSHTSSLVNISGGGKTFAALDMLQVCMS